MASRPARGTAGRPSTAAISSKPTLNQTGELNAAIWCSRMWVSSSSKALRVLVGREVAARGAPAGDRAGDAADHLLDRVLARGVADLPAEVLLGDDVRRVLRPALGELDVASARRRRGRRGRSARRASPTRRRRTDASPRMVNRRLIDSSAPGVVSWVVVGCVTGFIGLPPLRCAGARDAYSKLLSGPSIVPLRPDGKGGAAPIILEGRRRASGKPRNVREIQWPRRAQSVNSAHVARQAKPGLGHRVAQREQPVGLERPPPCQRPGRCRPAAARPRATAAAIAAVESVSECFARRALDRGMVNVAGSGGAGRGRGVAPVRMWSSGCPSRSARSSWGMPSCVGDGYFGGRGRGRSRACWSSRPSGGVRRRWDALGPTPASGRSVSSSVLDGHLSRGC